MTFNYLAFSAFLTLLLLGCGGGGGDSTPASTATSSSTSVSNEMTGIFLDSPVSGLRYACSFHDSDGLWTTEYGMTTTQGNFTCDKNSSISFFITDDTNRTILDLGYTKIEPIITPLDLSEFKYAGDAELMNVLQLLQTLDKDKNASNGIDIDFAKTKKLQNKNIYFWQNTFDKDLANYLEENLTTPDDAYTHFSNSLKEQNITEITIDYSTPVFSTPSSVTLYENIKKVIDINATDDNILVYKIEDTYSPFVIDKDSGELSFDSYGDYENGTSYSVTISANDGVNISYHTLRVNLLNIDENRPSIKNSSRLYVDENSLKAFDINATDESPLEYSISGEDSHYFDVNSSTGVVSFKTLSDYETKYSYKLTLTVSDNITDPVSRSVTLYLNPINDNIPSVSIEGSYDLNETTKYTNTSSIRFSAEDKDGDIMSLTLLGDDASFFRVSNSVRSAGSAYISFKKTPNYEGQKNSYTFQLRVFDGKYSILKEIHINLLDIDEIPPLFTLPAKITVDENQLNILDVNATDENILTYSVKGRVPYGSNQDTIFSIDSNGSLSWQKNPDYEVMNYWHTYYVDITVSDGFNKVVKMVEIVVNNLNDTAPIITSDANVSMPENTTLVQKVSSTDADKLTPSPTVYSLKDGDSALFGINNSTKEISFLQAPDFENDKHFYSFTLVADDGNQTGTQEIRVEVLDVDEIDPVFTTLDTNVTVDENQLDALQVSATDENNITFSLKRIGDYYKFDINATTGVIKFKDPADYEYKSLYSVTVIASDGINKPTQDITIKLNNLNDNAPAITGPTTATVYENSTNIAQYTIDDADDDNITLSFSNNLFDYNATSKYLFFKSAPDYESGIHSYSVRITASDSLYSSTHDLSITIKNKDDVVPSVNTFSKSIYENVPVGTIVGTVGISSSGDSNITNFYLSGTNSQHFTIDSNGTIMTNADIDYETLTNHRYDLEVKAKNRAGYSDVKPVTITIQDVLEKDIPTLVVVMNWTDYSESSATLWHDKIFNKSKNSAARWYQETSLGELDLVPLNETSGINNDGVIMVDMGVAHPGGNDNTNFRDTYIANAITNSEVKDNVDFAALDTNANGDLDISEIQIIFIVAGGEESYGDPTSHSIWAHAWSFGSGSTLSVDGVTVMKYNGDKATSGSYSRFGASHGDHSATIGVICHELGHAMLNLRDFYDDRGGSGLGWYDIMSGGAWAQQDGDTYAGETPTQFSTYNKSLSHFDMNRVVTSSSTTKTIKCSSNDDIKLTTSNANEYFLVECRDTAKDNSDISMNNARIGGYIHSANDSFANRLFTLVYHVDDTDGDSANNNESGTQTSSNHYNISILEKDPSTNIMTSEENIEADYNDVFIQGDVLDSTRTKLYDGSSTGYRIEITNEDYTDRTMTIKITK